MNGMRRIGQSIATNGATNIAQKISGNGVDSLAASLLFEALITITIHAAIVPNK
jgi:hypothetical protein